LVAGLGELVVAMAWLVAGSGGWLRPMVLFSGFSHFVLSVGASCCFLMLLLAPFMGLMSSTSAFARAYLSTPGRQQRHHSHGRQAPRD